MVCSVESGRMAVMARLLAAGSVSQTIAEEVGQLKLTVQYVDRELRAADEANLLDEEDMHVFGLMPMADPLDLVCCNTCKKPVKASQYAAHAELCRYLNYTEELVSEIDHGVAHMKPPRKERKKSSKISNTTPIGEQERSDLIEADDTVVSESQLVGQPGIPSAFSIDVKRNSACIDVTSMMDGKGVGPENTDHSGCVMLPPTKRSKLVSSQHLVQSENACGSKNITRSQDPLNCKDFPIQSASRNNIPNDCITVSKYPRHAHEHYMQTGDIPAPLATKIYYSQRNNRLRSAIARLYHVTSAKGLSNNLVSPEQESMIQLHASSQRGSSCEHEDDLLNKKMQPSVQNSDQNLAQSSEVCLDKLGGCLPVTNCSNEFPVDNIPRPQTAPIGLIKNKYLPKPYSFAAKSGKPLGTMQQANGGLPVL